jgi:hypothetical protein
MECSTCRNVEAALQPYDGADVPSVRLLSAFVTVIADRAALSHLQDGLNIVPLEIVMAVQASDSAANWTRPKQVRSLASRPQVLFGEHHSDRRRGGRQLFI